MDLPKEIRYRAYSDWSTEERAAIAENVNKSPWHVTYHIEPKTGLLNDPNGFSFLTANTPFSTKIGHLAQLMA